MNLKKTVSLLLTAAIFLPAPANATDIGDTKIAWTALVMINVRERHCGLKTPKDVDMLELYFDSYPDSHNIDEIPAWPEYARHQADGLVKHMKKTIEGWNKKQLRQLCDDGLEDIEVYMNIKKITPERYPVTNR